MQKIETNLLRSKFFYLNYFELLSSRLVCKDWNNAIFCHSFFCHWYESQLPFQNNRTISSLSSYEKKGPFNDLEIRKIERIFFQKIISQYLECSAIKKNPELIRKIESILSDTLFARKTYEEELFSSFFQNLYVIRKEGDQEIKEILSLPCQDDFSTDILLKRIIHSSFTYSIPKLSVRLNFLHAIVELITEPTHKTKILQQFLNNFIRSFYSFESMQISVENSEKIWKISHRIDLYLRIIENEPIKIDTQSFAYLYDNFSKRYSKELKNYILFSLLFSHCDFEQKGFKNEIYKILDSKLQKIGADLFLCDRTMLNSLKKKIDPSLKSSLSKKSIYLQLLNCFLKSNTENPILKATLIILTLICFIKYKNPFTYKSNIIIFTKTKSLIRVMFYLSLGHLLIFWLAKMKKQMDQSQNRYLKIKEFKSIIDRFPNCMDIE